MHHHHLVGFAVLTEKNVAANRIEHHGFQINFAVGQNAVGIGRIVEGAGRIRRVVAGAGMERQIIDFHRQVRAVRFEPMNAARKRVVVAIITRVRL